MSARLPLLPILKGKFTKPSYLLFRSPLRLDRVNASKVSGSDRLCLTDISRCDLDSPAVSQSVDLGRSNNPNTTPTKDYKTV